VSIFDNSFFAAYLTAKSPHFCRSRNVMASAPSRETRISIRYFWRLLPNPKKIKCRVINNLKISIRYFWKPCAKRPAPPKLTRSRQNSSLSASVAPAALPFSIFSFPFSSSANMAP
jgi:hypothetical protein